ncbi:hypothetical protein ACFPVT_10035 [Corynebacterium choanae]|uniref:hypothetical protein n=1 Tax=Corynebacterium choanae TaxID=1862358 RepID=UPI000F4EA9EA|nr:hypothetical protein [Corynebacterium choanae]
MIITKAKESIHDHTNNQQLSGTTPNTMATGTIKHRSTLAHYRVLTYHASTTQPSHKTDSRIGNVVPTYTIRHQNVNPASQSWNNTQQHQGKPTALKHSLPTPATTRTLLKKHPVQDETLQETPAGCAVLAWKNLHTPHT